MSQHAVAESDDRSALGRADQIMSAFDARHPTLSLPGLAARTGLPRSSTRRIVTKLVELGWLERRGDRFGVGNKLFEVAGHARVQSRLRAVALPHLEDLYLATRGTVHLGVLSGHEVLYVEKLAGHRPATRLTRVGGRMPAHCTAIGKALVAHSAAATEVVLRDAGLIPRTTSTITSGTALERELRAIRDAGVAFDREECEVGVACVAAPVGMSCDRAVAAISVTGAADRLPLARMASVVQAAALRVSRSLAGAAAPDHRYSGLASTGQPRLCTG